MTFILDTNVISEMRKGPRGTPSVLSWMRAQDMTVGYISVITMMELERGVLLAARNDPVQAKLLRRWIEFKIRPDFAGRIIPVSEAVALRCAPLHVPDKRPYADSLIAATALVHDLTVVTRNVRDFEPMGVRLLNPWDV